MHILVADTDPINQKVLVNMLAFQGHHASDLVGDEDALLDRLQENSVDLVLIDWSLVSNKDFNLIKSMRSRDLMGKHSLLVMMPGMDETLIELATKQGLRDFIPKPLPTHVLESKLSQWGKGHGTGAVDPAPESRTPPAARHDAPMAMKARPKESADSRAKRCYLSGKELLAKGRVKEAVNAFARAITAKECFPEALRALGVAFSRAKDMQRGKHFLDKAAEAYVIAGRFREATAYYTELKSKGFKPRNPFARHGDTLRVADDPAKAVELYAKALELEPLDSQAAFYFVKCCHQVGQRDRIIPVLITLLEATGGPDWARAKFRELAGSPWSTGPDTPAPRAREQGSQYLILIVDDEAHIRLLLEQTLESMEEEGVSLAFAENGEEGLKAVHALSPDLVFLDVMMPKLNGFDVCAAIKKDPALGKSYVAMLTAKGQEFDRKKGLAAGADVYMTKPFRPKDIIRLARSVLDLR